MMNQDRILSQSTVEGLIAEGQAIVIFENMILRLDSWLERHPGGRLVILHMVGRNATDEMKAYHPEKTLRSMKGFQIGWKQGPWVNRTPPIRGGKFQAIIQLADAIGSSKVAFDDTERCEESLYASGRQAAVDLSCNDNSGLEPSNAISLKWPPLNTSKKEGRASIHSCTSTKTSIKASLTHVTVADACILKEKLKDSKNYPSVDPVVQSDIAHKYQLLHDNIRDQGLYECRYIEYGKEMVRYSSLFIAFVTTLSLAWYMTSAVFLGLFWHQIMFTAHDAGHCAITHKFEYDALIGMFIANFCCGLSIGWWKSSHNVHHLVTNMPEHDPDIQNVPFFATCPSFFKSLDSTYYDGFTFVWDAAADFLVQYQVYTYYPVMAIARFNLYLLSWLHILSSKSSGLGGSKVWWIRPTEIIFMACYWFLFGYCLLWRALPTWTLRILFVLVSHIVTLPLHIQITLSHWGMSTANLGESESFAQRQLRTTMDIECPAWLDFIHGGLQFQAVHHLFPRVPRHNLRKVQMLVREFCNDTGITYSILSFAKGNSKVIGRLQEASDQLQIILDCQKGMAATGGSGFH
ncbi:Delta 8-(E)-sphingolipid desaturase [Paramyrothecium foliicola]|nr:Delta 8-(E)-sphingolipid desaturase [Paramyrothecium foliicola]